MQLRSQRRKALVYCRVSGKKQAIEGNGLDSQEHRCREYAREQDYEVEAVFPDDISGSGDFMRRPGMMALLAYMDAKPEENYVVIFDDLKRYARDTEFHLKLKREMAARNAKRECLNFKFEDSPEGEFIETIIAAQGELERKQNQRQVIQKMKARVEQGFWVFRAPAGYRYQRSKHGGKELVRDEPLASVVQEALKLFANGSLQTQVEVKRYLENQPAFPKDLPNGEIRAYRITRLLTQPVYAGYISAPNWNVSLRKARHEPLISLNDYNRMQDRIKSGGHAPARKDIGEDFVLRGLVSCADCGRPLTSCWSKSKTKKTHPYYRCYYKPCKSYGKSIRRAKIEGEFEQIIRSLKPAPSAFALASDMFKSAWTQRHKQSLQILNDIKANIATIELEIDQVLQRILNTNNQTVASAFEKKIEELEKDKLISEEKLQLSGKPKHSFEKMFELALQFLSNPWKLWDSDILEQRRLVLKLAFTGRIPYDRHNGFLNPKKSLPFNMIGDNMALEKRMVRTTGLEPV
ncbi:MAG TPA: resolvase [Rhizobiales bacterium]|nr:resolvase [Hyphomicrobiales bacterium]